MWGPPKNSVVQTPTRSQRTHTRTHIHSPCRVPPWTSPQVANLSPPSGWPGARTPSSQLPCACCPTRAAPGAGRGRRHKAPPRGRSGGRAEGGRRAGGRGGVPPSLALSGKVSRCCRAQPRLLLLLPRPGGGDCAPTSARAAPSRPPARQHGHHRHLHPLHRRLPALRGARQVRPASHGPQPCPRRLGAMRLLAPPPGPAPAAAAPPRPAPPPAFPARRLRGPPRPQLPVPQPPPRPAAAAWAAAPRVAAGTATHGPVLGTLQPRPSHTLQAPPISTLPARHPLPTLIRSSLSTLSHVPRAWHSGPSPALQLQACCGARV